MRLFSQVDPSPPLSPRHLELPAPSWCRSQVRFADLWFLVLLCGGFVACKVRPPVRLVTPEKGIFQEVRNAVGAEALFRERSGLTFTGSRTYPAPSTSETDEPAVERPISLFLRPDGAFLLSVGLAEAASVVGFDGREAWNLSPRGISSALGLGSKEHQLTDGWLRTFLWLTPGSERFSVTPVEPSAGDATLELRLKRLGEPIEVALLVDTVTKRPLSYSCLLYTSPSPRDQRGSRMPSSA